MYTCSDANEVNTIFSVENNVGGSTSRSSRLKLTSVDNKMLCIYTIFFDLKHRSYISITILFGGVAFKND
jgi:hypothetical protein